MNSWNWSKVSFTNKSLEQKPKGAGGRRNWLGSMNRSDGRDGRSAGETKSQGAYDELAKNETWTSIIKRMEGEGNWLEMGSRCVSITQWGRVWKPSLEINIQGKHRWTQTRSGRGKHLVLLTVPTFQRERLGNPAGLSGLSRWNWLMNSRTRMNDQGTQECSSEP